MIRLNNLTVNYGSKQVINDSEIEIISNKITIITGPSGSGKTTLLNILGLLLENKEIQYDYYFNDLKIDVHDKKLVSQVKRTLFSYVFQDYNLFDTMNVVENFKVHYYLCGKKYRKEEVQNCLSLVKLSDININKKVTSLSGGEKQRLAIALALVKNPEVILLDEPTANLDEENSKIIVDIIHQLKDEGKTIVISTHHKDLYNGDILYTIENKKIINEDGIKEVEVSNNIIDNCNKKTYFNIKYGILKFNSHLMINMLFVTLLALVIGYTSYNIVSARQANKIQTKQTETIANNEIFLVNEYPRVYEPGTWPSYYDDKSDNIKNEYIQQITNIEGVQSVYYYKCFFPWAYNYSNKGERNYIKENELGKINIGKNGETISNVNMSDRNNLYGLVTWDEFNAEEQCLIYDETIENGVYISNSFAQFLGIEDIEGITLKFNISIPIAQLRALANTIDGPTNAGSPYYIYTEVEYPIKGILNSDISGKKYYEEYVNNYIYINYNELDKLQKETQVSNQQSIDSYYDTNLHNGPIFPKEKTFYTFDLTSNALVIRVDDHKQMDNVKKELQLMNEYFVVKTKTNANEGIKDLTQQSYFVNIVIPIIVVGVLLIMVSIIYYFRNKKDKHNLALLKANGINHLMLVSISEIIISWLLHILLSIGIELIFINLINSHYKLGIPIDMYVIIVPVIISTLVNLCPIIVFYLMNRKINVTLLVRSS